MCVCVCVFFFFFWGGGGGGGGGATVFCLLLSGPFFLALFSGRKQTKTREEPLFSSRTRNPKPQTVTQPPPPPPKKQKEKKSCQKDNKNKRQKQSAPFEGFRGFSGKNILEPGVRARTMNSSSLAMPFSETLLHSTRSFTPLTHGSAALPENSGGFRVWGILVFQLLKPI